MGQIKDVREWFSVPSIWVTTALVSLLGLLCSKEVQGSPYPGLRGSQIVSPERGLYLVPRGFVVSTRGTSFVPQESASEMIRYQNEQEPSALLSVTIDSLNPQESIESFARKWQREYLQLGFKVRGTQELKLKGHNAVLLDLDHDKTKKSLRQLLIQGSRKAAILSCSSDESSFPKSLGECNRVMESFTWTSDPLFLKK